MMLVTYFSSNGCRKMENSNDKGASLLKNKQHRSDKAVLINCKS